MPNQMTASEFKTGMRCLLGIYMEQIKQDKTRAEIKQDVVSLHAQLSGLIETGFDHIKKDS